MTQLKLTKAIGGRKAGDEIKVSGKDVADRLVERGLAEHVKPEPKSKAKPKPEPKTDSEKLPDPA
jgi:endonuclease YncB( thermonuclease family)